MLIYMLNICENLWVKNLKKQEKSFNIFFNFPVEKQSVENWMWLSKFISKSKNILLKFLSYVVVIDLIWS